MSYLEEFLTEYYNILWYSGDSGPKFAKKVYLDFGKKVIDT